jgi:hypothetical protein
VLEVVHSSLHSNYAAWVGWVWGQVEKAEKLQAVHLTALEESLHSNYAAWVGMVWSQVGKAEEQDERVAGGERARAHRQLLAFLRMLECVLAKVASLALARLDGLSLPRLGLWGELVARAARAGLAGRWTEDLDLSAARCLLAGLRVLEGLGMPRLEEREGLVIGFLVEVAASYARLISEGLRSMLCSLSSLSGASLASQQTVVGGGAGAGRAAAPRRAGEL